MSQNYYTALGVEKGASAAEIKKAFHQKAKENHPDKGGDEAKFKEINQAYETLSDPQKKAQYDQFGSAGPQGGFGGSGGFSGFGGNPTGFDGMEDIFSQFFGGGFGGQQQGSNRPQQGSDLEIEIDLTLKEAIEGVSKKVPINRHNECEKCDSKGGSGQKACGTCGGSGQVAQKFQTPFGMVQQQTVCPTCKGQGQTFEKTCNACNGEGRKESRSEIEIKIPAGIDHGMTLRMRDQGDIGRRGAGRGDLYIHIRVKQDKRFVRDGLHLISEAPISIFKAIAGTTIEVETFWGKVEMDIPEKTLDRQKLRLKGKGIQAGGQIGDHIVIIRHKMPKKVSGKMKEVLEALD